ncbi:MAG: type III pantothenate kinase [Hyphomicrobiales bacterium]
MSPAKARRAASAGRTTQARPDAKAPGAARAKSGKEDPMLLAIDVGNTEVTLGLFEGRKLVRSFRLSSETRRTADETALALAQAVPEAVKAKGVASVLASVVPPQTPLFVEAARRLTGRKPLVVTTAAVPWLPIDYRDPGAVGADRIANAVAVIDRKLAPAIVVDFGTATTFDVISKDGRYLGGVITPGVLTGAEQLVRRAARLGAFELAAPPAVVGRSTEESLQSGVLYGAAGEVDAIVRRIAAERRFRPNVIATGGLATAIAPHTKSIRKVDPDLTLRGLRVIHERIESGKRG